MGGIRWIHLKWFVDPHVHDEAHDPVIDGVDEGAINGDETQWGGRFWFVLLGCQCQSPIGC